MINRSARVLLGSNELLSSTFLLGAYGLEPPQHWDRGFESLSRHGCMSTFFYVLLSRAGRELVMAQCPAQGVLPKCLKGFIISEVKSHSE